MKTAGLVRGIGGRPMVSVQSLSSRGEGEKEEKVHSEGERSNPARRREDEGKCALVGWARWHLVLHCSCSEILNHSYHPPLSLPGQLLQ